MTEVQQQEIPYFLRGNGEMASRMRSLDWSLTPLGPIENWSETLKVAVSICLQSSHAIALYWGPDLTLLYNDAWAPIPAERHPGALGRPGREVWADIWDVVGPQMEEVLATGKGFDAHEQLLDMVRGGRRRSTWWNYSFTPVLGSDGLVEGILNEGLDVTDQVLNERRLGFLLQLNDAMRDLDDPAEVVRTSQEMLGKHLQVNRVGYGEVDESERWFTTIDNWTDDAPSRHGVHDLAAFGPEVHGDLKAGIPLAIEDVATDPRTSSPEVQAAFEAIDTQAALTASLVKNGRMVAALYVHAREARAWSEADARLVQDVAERTWADVARAKAEAAARGSEERYRRVFEQTSDLIITSSLDRVVTDCNQSAADAVGMTRDEVIGRSMTEFISPEDWVESTAMLNKKLDEGGTTRWDVRVRDRHGEILFWGVNSGLTYDESGQPVGLHVVGRDVTERRRWETHQRLLVGELNHRVKNTLSIVQSLTHQTFRGDKPRREAVAAFEGRLQALAAAHRLLTHENWEAAAIGDIVREALKPFCDGARCASGGPRIRLIPQTAVSLTLAIHELATNASKYGALSRAGGRVTIDWRDSDEDWLRLRWTESGGPPVSEPTSAGFGSRMLKRALAADLGGEVRLNYPSGGLICEIDAPLPDLADEGASISNER